MKTKEDKIDSLVAMAIQIFDTNKAYMQDRYHFKMFNQYFCTTYVSEEQRKKIQDELIARYHYETKQFTRIFHDFCQEYAVNELKIIEKANKSSDYYLALIIAMLKELNQTNNYRFNFMGLSYPVEYFSGKINPLYYFGNFLLISAIALCFVLLPTILFTQPCAIGLMIGISLITMTLSLLLGYCGAMISENQMPFTGEDAEHPPLITRIYGYFKPYKNINPLEVAEQSIALEQISK